ncbi:MAG TPA: mannosyltransferase family protein [Chthoniobacterales bacterium]|nr:mannosyltransferase family protein [Chthoniobacterales bacterium]
MNEETTSTSTRSAESDPWRTIATAWARVTGLLSREDWLVVGWVFAIRILLFVFGSKSYQILENKRTAGWFGWVDLWNRWDADQYLKLAKFGYTNTTAWKAWFYPLYPWCVRIVAFFNGNYLVSALVVSFVALIVAAILLRRIVLLDFSSEIALRSVWFFLIFPTALFLHAPYTESLFLALAIGSVFAARKDRWWLAGALGALSWMTRANGIVLIPTLAMEAGYQFWKTKRWDWRWLWIALIPLGFAVYLFLNWRVTGDPFSAFHQRKPMFFTEFTWPWTGMHGAMNIMMDWKPDQAEMVGTQEFLFALLGLIGVVLSWIKLRPIYAMWMTGNWLLLASVTFLQSMPRYTLTMFPLFILFGLLAANRFWNFVLIVWSLLFMALFTSLFMRGWWAF